MNGSTGGPVPVVLLHAFPLDGRMWGRQAQALGDEFRVVAPDARGFGSARDQASGSPELSIEHSAADVLALLDRLALERVVLGGISRGGYIAMAFARNFPGRLLGLMLFDTRATPASEKERNTFSDMAKRLRSEGIGFLPGVMKERLFGPGVAGKPPALVEEVKRIILSQDAGACAAAALGMADRPDARPGLAAIRVPVLAVAGTEDGAFEDTRAIAQAIPGAVFREVPAAAHLTNMERPGLVNEWIRGFAAQFRVG